MNKTAKQSLIKVSALAALLATSLGVGAAGLGKLTVYSAIGQPLNAEVAISASPEELGSLSARLASQEAFREAGIDFMPALSGLRFGVSKVASGQPILKLFTDKPLNEPFLHFLIELNWTSGRVVREYTFLLDPPEMLQVAKPASVVAPETPAVKPVAPAAIKPVPLPAPDIPAPVAKAEPAKESPRAHLEPATPATTAGAGEREVKPGDTLSKIAREVKSASVNLDQMLVALFNSNRDAFVGNNMNRLRAGKILRLPEQETASAIDPVQARKVVVGQAADFNAYKRRLAEAAGTAPAAGAEPSQQVTGKIAPRVEDNAPQAAATDKLQVSRTETSKLADASRKGLEEDLIARDKALREATQRIVELEKNLDNAKKLVELKSQQGAQMQQQAQASAAATKPVEVKGSATPSVKPPVDAAPAAAKLPVAPVPVAPQSPSTTTPAAPAKAPPPPAKPEVRKPAPPPSPAPEPDFLEEYPEILYGAGGVAALLLAYLAYGRMRRSKLESQPLAESTSISEPQSASTKSGAVFGAASESVDSGEVSIQGDFSETGVLTTEESVDPVAEADVLMAYGRDGQAEEILLEGLRADPTRSAIHLKLLELYANRNSSTQFEAVAQQLHGLNGGQGPEWGKALALAQGLGISSGLFAGDAATSGGGVAEELVPSPQPESAAETVGLSSPEPEPEAITPAEEPDGSLDFDLDLGTTSGPALAAAAAQVEAAPTEDIGSLDFDFDLGSPEPETASSAAPADGMPSSDAGTESSSIDFSLDLGSIDIAPASVPAELAAVPAGVSDIDFDIDFGSTSSSLEPEGDPDRPAHAEDADIGLDFDLGDDAAPELVAPPVADPDTATAVAAPLDLSAISLDLDEPAPSAELPDIDLPLGELVLPDVAPEAQEALAAVPGSAGDFDLALDIGEQLPEDSLAATPDDLAGAEELLLPDAATAASYDVPEDADGNPEVATKLELAQAYEEMGDLEGARELLNEVLNEGTAAQQATAQARLDLLNA